MNEFYNVLTEHDEVLDGLEYSIIAVNLPVSLRDGEGAARLRAVRRKCRVSGKDSLL